MFIYDKPCELCVPTSTTPLLGVCTVIMAALSNMNVIL